MVKYFLILTLSFLLILQSSWAVEKPDTTYQIFQFPANMIPRIDGDAIDWDMVPESYVIGTDQLWDVAVK